MKIDLPKALVLVLLIVIVFVVLKIVFSKLREKYANDIAILRKRLAKAEKELLESKNELGLQRLRMNSLNARAERHFRILKWLCCTSIAVVFVVFYFVGTDLIQALESTAILFGVPATFISIALTGEPFDLKALAEIAMLKLKMRIYRRNGFDPNVIDTLESKVEEKHKEILQLRSTIDSSMPCLG